MLLPVGCVSWNSRLLSPPRGAKKCRNVHAAAALLDLALGAPCMKSNCAAFSAPEGCFTSSPIFSVTLEPAVVALSTPEGRIRSMRVSVFILVVCFAVDGVLVGAAGAQAGMNPSRSSRASRLLAFAGRNNKSSSTASFGSSGGRGDTAATAASAAAGASGAIPAFSLPLPPLLSSRNRRSGNYRDAGTSSGGGGRFVSSGSNSRGSAINGSGAIVSTGRLGWGTTASCKSLRLSDSRNRAVGGASSGRRFFMSLGALNTGSGAPGGGGKGNGGRLASVLPYLQSSPSGKSRFSAAPASFSTWASSLPGFACYRQQRLSRPSAASLSASGLAFSSSADAAVSKNHHRSSSSFSSSSSPLAASFSSAADTGGATSTNAPDDKSSGVIDDTNSNSSGGNTDGEEWPAPHPSQGYVARAKCGQRYEHDVETGGATRIRAVVSDLDGTLLGPDKLVSAATLEAVREARSKGIIFVPASGRSKTGMIASMGELGKDLQRDGAPLVCMNGLTVYGQANDGREHGDIIHSELMCSKLAAQVVAFWKAHPLAQAAGVSLCGSEGETIVVESLDARTRSFTDYREPLPKEVGNWEDAIAGGIELNRLYFWGETRAAVDAFQDDLKAHLKDHPAELTRGVPEMIEVLPHGASKAVGLEALLNHLGVSPHEVIALGDMENDVEMLQAVGHGVAMGQASLEVRQAARFTAPTNALDGVAVALETFCGVRLSD